MKAICLEDTKYHLEYLANAIFLDSPDAFSTYMQWVRNVLESRKVPTDSLLVNLDCLETVLSRFLKEDVAVILPYIKSARELLKGPSFHARSQIEANNPLNMLASDYLAVILNGNRSKAREQIRDAREKGTSIKDLYLHVFQPVEREIGRLWESNKISVAHEHFATAVTQFIMSELYPDILAAPPKKQVAIATCVGNELHEIGIRMVADFLQLDGWTVYYLGANLPTDAVVSAVNEYKPNLLAISATLLPHVSRLANLVNVVRKSAKNSLKILVGGYPFSIIPDLYTKVGADGFALDAERAVTVANELVGN